MFTGGRKPLFDPKEVVQQQGRGAAYTFTIEIRHFPRKQNATSAQAQARCDAEDRRFPSRAHEDRSLQWQRTRWRPWDADERAQPMGLHVSIVSPMIQADLPLHCRQSSRSTAVGNSFHVLS